VEEERTTSPGRRAVQVLVAIVATLAVVAAGLVTVAPPASAARAWTLRDPFSREVVRRGDADTDPYHIEHVYEVQRRLKRLGLFDATPNGRFGPVTEAAVKTFQRRNGLAPTGVVGYRRRAARPPDGTPATTGGGTR
jgi:peptidoglycan hydrolase-like protein with peptidoglycan-binding domain